MSELVIIEKKDGKYSLEPLKRYLDVALDASYRLEIKRIRKNRSNDQNGWLWGCIYPMLLKGLNDIGWEFVTCNQVHEFFKSLLYKQQFVNHETGEVVEIPASTAEMDTITFCTYCDKLRDYAREYLNVEIPDPNKMWRFEL